MAHNYSCKFCDTKLKKHDNCGDWFGYTQNVGYICPDCGIQYEKKEHSKFKMRDKVQICLTESEKLKIDHYDKYKISIPLEIHRNKGEIRFENELFERTSEKNKDNGHPIYKLKESNFNQKIEIPSHLEKYIRKKIESAPAIFEYDFSSVNHLVVDNIDNITDILKDGKTTPIDLIKTNYRDRFSD